MASLKRLQLTIPLLAHCRRISLFACVVLLLSACSTVPGGKLETGKQAQISDSRSVQNLLAKALQAIDSNDSEAAAAAFTAMLEKGAKSPASLNHYAIYLREQWQLEQAEEVYLRALVSAPNDAMTHYNLGILYDIYLGKSELALKHYQKYQQVIAEPDKRVGGWINDLKRRSKEPGTGSAEVAS